MLTEWLNPKFAEYDYINDIVALGNEKSARPNRGKPQLNGVSGFGEEELFPVDVDSTLFTL